MGNLLDKWLAAFNGEEGYASDADATDAYFEAAYHAPVTDLGTIDTGIVKVKENTREISRTIKLTAGVPVQALPADPDRVRLNIIPGMKYNTVLATNLVTNPQGSAVGGRYSPFPGVGGLATLDYVPRPRVTWSQSPSPSPDGGVTYGTSNAAFRLPANSNTIYSIAGTFKASIDVSVSRGFWCYDSGGAFLGSVGYPTTLSLRANEYMPFEILVRTREGTAAIGFLTRASSVIWPVGSTLELFNLCIVESDTIVSYFDGDAINARWTGPPNQSTSQLLSGSMDFTPYRLASDKTDLASAAPMSGLWRTDFHTGAVWLLATEQDMTVSVSATTR